MEIPDVFSACIPVGSIAVIAFAVGLFCKTWDKLDDKWIPCICAALGGLLGVVGLYVIPDYPANNVMDAIMHGIFSGLVATGAHQIGKQFQKARKAKNEQPAAPDTSLTWEQYQADKGHVTVLNTEEEHYDGD